MNIEKFVLTIPQGRQFTVKEIADALYPQCIMTDSQGHAYNRASGTAARLLRKHSEALAIVELQPGEFHSI